MRRILPVLVLGILSGCAGPLPIHDPALAWVDLSTMTGRLVMADKLDGQNTYDGRYFQMTPGSHQLVVRFDYEYRSGAAMGMFSDDYTDITCFIHVNYDGFKAGERYRLQVRTRANDIEARLYDAQRQEVARESDMHCI